ncbi:DUF2955 domain-containing protein [Paracoccus sp. Z118]|uniref:DUF2955 domain-containing protein n=1 Tax=Paracoccus sp. Z118 TaxID=2851017 RepID=UPI001C2B7B02|nr:DUF2955 domain-containing protein [Paracoccus sp. Z118]MBV0893382.1 DUF2955 domain-containing protein [Paracoccus sp. Z118]
MSAEVERLRIRRHGFRVAAAVAVGFVWAGLAGQVIPFLGPLFAIQLLMAPRPPGLGQGIGMVTVILAGSVVMLVLTGVVGDRPVVLSAFLALVYFACFLAQATGRGGGAPFLVLVVAIIVPMLGVLKMDLGQPIVAILLDGVGTGLLLTWAAHAVFPDPGGLPPAPPPPAPPVPGDGSTLRAITNAGILLAMVVYCMTNDALASAAVVPITVASLLGQLALAKGPVAVVGLMVVNLLGGIVASLAFTVYELRPSAPWLLAVVLVVGLLFGGKAAADRATAPIYAGSLIIFCILFGLGVSPLPGTAAESFSTRVSFVLLGILYTVTLAALLWRPTQADVTVAT